MYMGKDSEARKRLQRNNSFNRRRQSFDGRQRSQDFPRSIGCRCQACNQTKRTCEEIKKMILEKLDIKIVDKVPDPPAAVNLY